MNTSSVTTTAILHDAFDQAYLALLEEGSVSLDDEMQQRVRDVVIPEVEGVLRAECERMGLADEDRAAHVRAHALDEVSRRVSQELQEDETAPEGDSVASRSGLVLLPALEPAKG